MGPFLNSKRCNGQTSFSDGNAFLSDEFAPKKTAYSGGSFWVSKAVKRPETNADVQLPETIKRVYQIPGKKALPFT